MAAKVAIIGAGPAGLSSIKAALEAGLDPTAYETDSWLGGIWNFSEETGRNCGALCTITNTSKHVMCFSDFPMPKTCPNYLTLKGYHAYLESYAESFNLVERIRFNEEVVEVKKCSDYEDTGKWEVHSRKKDDRDTEVKVAVYDFVMVASGMYSEPMVPKIPGVENFSGNVIHSQQYKTFKGFEGKRVLVIGLGNTAGDIACELSRHASQVYISTRRGSWVLPRLDKGGMPLDRNISRLAFDVPQVLFRWLFAQKVKSTYNLANFGLETAEHPARKFPIINDELPHRIITGSVIIKTDIKEFQNNTVLFKDNTCLDNIDAVIFATGFDVTFPFLSNSWLKPKQEYIPLYKFVFPCELSRNTIALIGAFRAAGPVPPLCEMQARWAVKVFKGECKLPGKKEMMKDILDVQEEIRSRVAYVGKQFFHHVRGPVPYMDDIGSLIGVRPNLLTLALHDPALAIRCYFGPWVPAQYRLMGPGAWSGAKDVINDVEESYLAPMKTRVVKSPSKTSSGGFYIFMLAVLVVLVAYLLVYRTG